MSGEGRTDTFGQCSHWTVLNDRLNSTLNKPTIPIHKIREGTHVRIAEMLPVGTVIVILGVSLKDSYVLFLLYIYNFTKPSWLS